MKILVTGGNGQLGKCIWDISKRYAAYEFVFTNYIELDITNEEKIKSFFGNHKFEYCINCAAYTAVDKAESDQDNAFLVNAEAVRYLAQACKAENTILIHISTDFVFDGSKTSPYTEEDITKPINFYGASKLKGEQYVQELLNKYFIIRTSWVYSEYGHNFVKTMLRLAQDRGEISVVNDQIGSPTYAGDLAEVLMTILSAGSKKHGIYHYSNEGEISWYEFAKAIFELAKINCKVLPIANEAYPAPARRPVYSVLDKARIKNDFNPEIGYWKDSLANCLLAINKTVNGI